MPLDIRGLEEVINRAFPVTHLDIHDESSGCGERFSIVLVSEAFEGKRTLARHRLVNETLKDQIAQMHAFSQKTHTPDEWDKLANKNSASVSQPVATDPIEYKMEFKPPYPPWDPTDTKSFSYDTLVRRWPIIITSVIDIVHQKCHDLTLQINEIDTHPGGLAQSNQIKKDQLQEKIAEGTNVIEKVSKLKYDLARDRTMEPISEDGEFGLKACNDELEVLEKVKRNTWFTAPWLYAECYLYRLLRSFFLQTKFWRTFDPFYDQKVDTFRQSGQSIHQIATTMHELAVANKVAKISSNPEKLGIVFKEMTQMCLWGNATDLSLLSHISQDDILHLQSVGKEAQTSRAKFILKDDQEAAWRHLQTLQNSRIDFILDNAGFELFTDLVFADFLVSYTPYVSHVVFHPKLIPWFVSDVTPPDFKTIFSLLTDQSFFTSNIDTQSTEHLQELISRWNTYLENGIFTLSVPVDTPLGGDGQKSKQAEFWTSSKPYWDMKSYAPETFAMLEKSGLVIFKGDLNYRKLTGDVRWPAWTPFEEAIGPLSGSFPLLSLRTNKADVVAGVEREVAERLDESGERWRVDGRYALVSFVHQSAVI